MEIELKQRRVVNSLRSFLARVRQTVCVDKFSETIAISTLFLLILHGKPGSVGYYFKPAMVFVAVPAILYRPLLRFWGLWLFIALVYSLEWWRYWYPIDNHKYLLLYWVIVLLCSTAIEPQRLKAFMSRSARFFLVFVMGVAALQKLAQPTYVDSSFFEFTLLYDRRFETLAVLLGADRADLTLNRGAVGELKHAYLSGGAETATLRSFALAGTAAFLITWWDLLVQVAIAACFAVGRRAADLIGHVLLLIFIFTTYFFAPVLGFGWMIAILGFAVAAPRLPSLAVYYVGAFPLMAVYDLPWNDILKGFL